MKKYSITEYGAKPDGTICTDAIQRAIDLCEKGGTVYVPVGTFVTGALYLKSDMTLYLEADAKLLGSANVKDFPIMGYPFEGRDQLCYASLINTDSAPHRNITIEGEGTIDANGVTLFLAQRAENKGARGRAVCIRNTDNLIIKGVKIRQSPAWCLHLLYCENVLLDNIEIHSKYDESGNRYEHIFNGDGIDIDSCKDVRIINSLITSQDDCIAIKSGRDEEGRRVGIPSKNVTIENCSFKSGFGVAIGSEMSGGVENVTVKDCTFENTHSIASIKATRGRGGYIKNIRYENCSHINHSTEYTDTKWFRGALYADSFYGEAEFNPDEKAEINEGTPVVDGVYMKNITVDTIAGNAVYLYGLPEMPYRNFHLENITAHGKYGMKVKNIENLELVNVNVAGDGDK